MRNQLLDASRGAAALAVVAYHAGAFIGPAYWSATVPGAELGRYGVHFFFVLSGFLMMQVHGRDIGRPGRLAHFAARRFTRIYPAYWMALAAVLLAFALAPGLGEPEQRTNLLGAVLLIGEPSDVMSVAWTLYHEVLFYALFALLIANRLAGAVIMALWLIGCAIGGPGYVFAPINLLFGVGMALGLLVRRLPEIAMPRAFGSAGEASYSIYLVHYPVLGLAAMMLRGLPVWLGLPLATGISVAAGVLFHRQHQPILLMVRRCVEAVAGVSRFALSSRKHWIS